MSERIICAGFGGQGIMLLGKVLAQAALKEDKQVTWIPSYGAAVRGGCAFCMVSIADENIASPYVHQCDTLFVFNEPSWHKFKGAVRKNGLALLNSTLIQDRQIPREITVKAVPFTEIASSLGEIRAANMVALGSFLKEKEIFKLDTILSVLQEIAPKNKRHLLPVNQKALEKGYHYK